MTADGTRDEIIYLEGLSGLYTFEGTDARTTRMETTIEEIRRTTIRTPGLATTAVRISLYCTVLTACIFYFQHAVRLGHLRTSVVLCHAVSW